MIKLCECGCGEIVKNRFVSGHNGNRRGVILSKESKKKMSESAKIAGTRPEVREKRSKSAKIARTKQNNGKTQNMH